MTKVAAPHTASEAMQRFVSVWVRVDRTTFKTATNQILFHFEQRRSAKLQYIMFRSYRVYEFIRWAPLCAFGFVQLSGLQSIHQIIKTKHIGTARPIPFASFIVNWILRIYCGHLIGHEGTIYPFGERLVSAAEWGCLSSGGSR